MKLPEPLNVTEHQLRRSCPTITPGFNRGLRDITSNNPVGVSQKNITSTGGQLLQS